MTSFDSSFPTIECLSGGVAKDKSPRNLVSQRFWSSPGVRVWSQYSAYSSAVAIEEPTKPFSSSYSSDLASQAIARLGKEDPILLPLVVPLPMVMIHVLGDGRAESALPKENELAEALFLDGFHEPFCEGVEIGALWWEPKRTGAGIL